MAKKKIKDPLTKRWTKLRAAIRNVWQYDHERKAVITAATEDRQFVCPLCKHKWPIELATVDHEPELGGFNSWDTFFSWTRRCFEGPQRAVCKPCHRKKTATTRRKKSA